MKTNNLELELISPDQLNKEVFFNENLLKIDSFINHTVQDFVEAEPSEEFKDRLFIISSDEHKDKIIFATSKDSEWEYLTPKTGMIFFICAKNSFYIYSGKEWIEHSSSVAHPIPAAGSASFPSVEEVPSVNNFIPDSFDGTVKEQYINKEVNYFYLNEDTKFMLKGLKFSKIDIILKQNYSNVFNVEFDVPVIWLNGEYVPSRTSNNFDYIRLINLPETDHFICEIVKSNFSY